MKSIVLSLEGEINDQILKQLEDEVNKLDLLYTEHQRELFDLKREKKELEAFLSTFADASDVSSRKRHRPNERNPSFFRQKKNPCLKPLTGNLTVLS